MKSKKPKIKKIPSLLEVFDKVNATHLGGLCIAGIKWASLRSKEEDTILGKVFPESRIIVVNAILQDPSVPLYVLEGIVLHECLHLLIPDVVATKEGYSSKKDLWHTYKFLAHEQRYDVIKKADEWLDNNLWGLVASKRIKEARPKI